MSSGEPTLQMEQRPVPMGEPPVRRSAPAWTTGAVIAALLCGLGGIALGAYAVSTKPAQLSGPAGPPGARGPQGPQGLQGKQGPSGTISATSITRGATKTTAPDPQPGTVLEATTRCPSGEILVGGGAQVSAPGVTADRNVTLRSSFPVNTTSWQTVALVTGSLGQGVSMTMTPYVLCGQPAGSTTTGSATTTSSVP